MFRTRRIYSYAGLLLVQLAAVLAIGWPTPLQSGFPLDDAWIHQTAARNLVEHGTLGLVPGHFGSGTTSVLWVLVLAINHASLHWPPSLYSTVLGVLLLILTGQSVLYCAHRDGWDNTRAWLFAALLSISPNFAWFAFSGMEVCLFTALLVIGVMLSFSDHDSPRTSLACGLILASLFLTRPESLVLCVVLLGLPLRAKRAVSRVAWASLPLLAAVFAYVGANFRAYHQVSPLTSTGRTWLWMQETADWSWIEPRRRLIAHWLDRLWRLTLAETWLPLYWAIVGLSALGVIHTIRKGGRVGALVALATFQLGTYLLLLPVEGHGGRYQPLIAALFLPLACEGAAMVLKPYSIRGRSSKWMVLLSPWILPAVLLPALAACLGKWSAAQALSVLHINETEVAMGRWVAGLPSHARVASFDMGGLAYFGNHRLLDLGGLSDPEPIYAVQQGKIREMLELAHIDYLIVPMGYSDEFPDPWSFMWRLGLFGEHRPTMSRVQEYSSPPDIWVPGLEATLHSAPRQIAFHITQYGSEPR